MKGKAYNARQLKNYKKCTLVRLSLTGLSVKEMARILYIDPGTVYKWRQENGCGDLDTAGVRKDKAQRIYLPSGKGANKAVEITYTGRAYHTKGELAARSAKRKRWDIPGTFKPAAEPSERVWQAIVLKEHGWPVADIAGLLDISPQSVYKALRRWQGRYSPGVARNV